MTPQNYKKTTELETKVKLKHRPCNVGEEQATQRPQLCVLRGPNTGNNPGG